jgi:hypothetical protein
MGNVRYLLRSLDHSPPPPILVQIMNVVLTCLFHILFNVATTIIPSLQWPYPDGDTPPSYDYPHVDHR